MPQLVLDCTAMIVLLCGLTKGKGEVKIRRKVTLDGKYIQSQSLVDSALADLTVYIGKWQYCRKD